MATCRWLLVLLFLARAAAAAAPIPVYSNDFEHEPGTEWSKREIARTPAGNRPFLGMFGGESVTFRLGKLPPHKMIRVEFDLYVINPVDGSSPIWGPDVWDLSVIDGPTLLHTTFDNCGFFSDNNEQAFPDEFNCGKPHPGWSGAAERRTLGYTHSWGGPDRTWDCSSVYHFAMEFPHEQESIALAFTSFSKEDKDGEAWGLAHFAVDAEADVPAHPPGSRKLGELWEDLAGADPMRAFEAKWALIARPGESLPFLRSRLGCDEVEERAVGEVIAGLSDNDPSVRAKANDALAHRDPRAAAAVLTAMASPDNPPEVNARLRSVVRTFIAPAGNDREAMRRARAIHALEIILGLPNEARRSELELPRAAPGP
jgi:hypothetical protein